MKRKAVEDVLDAETSFKDADSTSGMCFDLESITNDTWSRLIIFSLLVACPSCDNDRAYYYQLQIRSADEPMTTCMWFNE